MSFNKLADWAEENKICINAEKTVSMTFRSGGKQTIFYHKANPLAQVPHVKYLGIILQTSGDKIALHFKDRVSTSNRSMNSIKLLRKLSLKTAVKLFNLKVSPVATYGIENIWPFLTKDKLANLEKMKKLVEEVRGRDKGKKMCVLKTTRPKCKLLRRS